MVQLLYGLNDGEIDNYIKNQITSENSLNELDDSMPLEDIIIDLSYNDIFSSKKIDIIRNPKFINEKDIDIDRLLKFMNDKSNPNELYIIVNEEKLDERKKIIKILKEDSKYFPQLTANTCEKYIKEKCRLNNYKIDTNALQLFIKKINGNYKIINNELEKLFLLKISDKTITSDDVKAIVSYNIENNTFKLIDKIRENNKRDVIKIYSELIDSKIEPIMIIGLLAKQYRLYLQVKILIDHHKTKEEIEEITKEHPYRIKLAIEDSYKYSKEYLISKLYNLSMIDEQIKTNYIDSIKVLENFLLDI